MGLNEWAARRDGLIHSRIALRSGLSKSAVSRRVRSGRYVKVRRYVVAVGGVPPTWRQQVRAVLLSRPEVAASHCTSFRLLTGLTFTDDGSIHVLGPLEHRVTMDGVIDHRSSTFSDCDVISRDGMRCTSALRTVIDLSGSLSYIQLGEAVDELLRRRLLSLRALRDRVDTLRPAPGRSVAKLRRALADRIPGYDPGESALEARIMRVLIADGLPMPVQQHRVSYGGARYRIDFAWPDRKIYLEGNGFGFHSLTSDLDRDARRQNSLVLNGWRPIEITWRMSDSEIAATIAAFLRP